MDLTAIQGMETLSQHIKNQKSLKNRYYIVTFIKEYPHKNEYRHLKFGNVECDMDDRINISIYRDRIETQVNTHSGIPIRTPRKLYKNETDESLILTGIDSFIDRYDGLL
ncbi:hypothetical protein HAU06_20590 [Bacillus toyonensis]|uniref:hypothetical protein n=1 Tax=Bacillus toyonensis TaxID=155322 RepID=UPI000BEB7A90|nr:hypothetical protein [Bacillus toyonensis]MBC2686476.1 hypothetical protein [Bacillus toyonensis]PDY86321.1 hypothetical protein CON67_25380 [Bacillus toyonensis]